MSICGFCHKEFTPRRGRTARTCSDRCRSALRRQNGLPGKIKSVRELARGGFNVIVHFETTPHLQAGSRCRLETE